MAIPAKVQAFSMETDRLEEKPAFVQEFTLMTGMSSLFSVKTCSFAGIVRGESWWGVKRCTFAGFPVQTGGARIQQFPEKRRGIELAVKDGAPRRELAREKAIPAKMQAYSMESARLEKKPAFIQEFTLKSGMSPLFAYRLILFINS